MTTPKKYKVRSGTIDNGKDYEIKMTALLALKCCSENLEHFWLASNVDCCGALDDIVIYIKRSTDNGITYLIQLKHQDGAKNIIDKQLLATKGDFSVEKYHSSYSTLKYIISDTTRTNEILDHLGQVDTKVFILFTNKGVAGTFKFLNKEVTIPHLEVVNVQGKIFGFNCIEFKTTINDLDFLENLYLYTNQPSIKEIDKEIIDAIRNFIPIALSEVDLAEMSKNYVIFVGEWWKGHLNGHYPLTKTLLLKKFTELLYLPHIVKVIENGNCDENAKIWYELLTDKDVTVINEADATVEEYVKNSIQSAVINVDNLKIINEITDKSKRLLRTCTNPNQLTFCEIYEILWKTRSIPVVLNVYTLKTCQDIQDILNWSQGTCKILILNKTKEDMKNVSHNLNFFRRLDDLNKTCKEKLFELPVKLQDRNVLSIRALKGVKEQIFNLLTVKDIVYILSGKFNIGNELENLPEFFIDMSLAKVWMETSVLIEVHSDIFVIRCKYVNNLKVFLRGKSKTGGSQVKLWEEVNQTNFFGRIIVFKEDKYLNEIETFCSSLDKPTHFLIWHGNDDLEWIKSNSTIKNITRYRKLSSSFKIIAAEALVNFTDRRKTFLVSANPGMGKSVLMNYFAHYATTNVWVVQINLAKYKEQFRNWNEHTENMQDKHFKQFLETILLDQKVPNRNLAREILSELKKSKNILLLLDGFDEVPVTCQLGAKSLISYIDRSGYFACVTTRPVLKIDLENLLDTFAVTVSNFTTEEQIYYLTHYFAKVGKTNPTHTKVASFAGELLEATRKNLNDLDNEFTGVPLQTNLLAEVFETDFTKFLNGEPFNNKQFDLIYLYKRFINKKIKIAWSKIERISEDIIHLYKLCRCFCALQLLFPAEDLEELKINEKRKVIEEMLPTTYQMIQKDGIIVIESEYNISFVHRTFAEYLAAERLSENVSTKNRTIVQSLIKKSFDFDLVLVRNMFDRILANSSPLLTAIINHQFETAKDLITLNSNALNDTDVCKRSFLHVLASWGIYHPRPYKDNSVTMTTILRDPMISIIEMIPDDKVTSNKDDLLNFTPLDYAFNSGSLNVANKLCVKMKHFSYCLDTFNIFAEYIDSYCRQLSYFPLVSYLHDFKVDTYSIIFNQHVNESSDSSTELTLKKKLGTEVGSVYSLMHFAVKVGALEVVKNLILQKADIKMRDTAGNSLLHWASIEGHTDMVALLIEQGADVEEINNDHQTSLHWAVNQGQIDVVDLLLSKGANIEARDKSDFTPLCFAVSRGNTDMLIFLLAKGANAQVSDRSGRQFILYIAATMGFTDVANVLISHSVNIEQRDEYNATPLHWAAVTGSTKLVQLLLDKGANLEAISSNGLTPLLWASEEGQVSAVELLLDKGANQEATNRMNCTALQAAALIGHADVVNLLLVKGAYLESRDINHLTSLHKAALMGHKDIVSLLIDNGANIEAKTKRGETPLNFAAMSGKLDVINLLLNKGADIDTKDEINATLLHNAAMSSQIDVVNLLLQYGADIEAKDDENFTPLHRAARVGQADCVKFFIANGANIEAKTIEGATALHWAAFKDHVDIINLLLANGANLEAVENRSFTPLYLSVLTGSSQGVTLLINYGANVNVKDVNNTSCLQWAVSQGFKDIVSLLVENGANPIIEDASKRTLLHWAVGNTDVDLLQILLDKEMYVDSEDVNGTTPLLLATQNGLSDMVSLLLKHKANVNVRNKSNLTPLHCAINQCHTDVVKLLLTSNVDLEVEGKDGSTPFSLAVKIGNVDIIRLLVNKGVDVNKSDDKLFTALHWASVQGTTKIADLLLSKGAEINAQNCDGSTPLHLAVSADHINVVNLLLVKGANLGIRDKCGLTASDLARKNSSTKILSAISQKQ